MSRKSMAAIVLPVLLALAGCGGSSAPAQVKSGSPHVWQVSEKQKGQVLHVSVGDTVQVTLHNTYWMLSPVRGNALVPLVSGGPSPGGSGCPNIPGTGCGVVSQAYHAQNSGTSTLRAHRTSCGEAMRCVGSAGSWSVTVDVS